MKKSELIQALGGPSKAAKILRISRQGLYHWSESLDGPKTDRVVGALMRTGRIGLAEDMLKHEREHVITRLHETWPDCLIE